MTRKRVVREIVQKDMSETGVDCPSRVLGVVCPSIPEIAPSWTGDRATGRYVGFVSCLSN